MSPEEIKIRLDERLKIARDLHDQFSASIAALNINFSTLKKKLPVDLKENEQSYKNLEKVNHTLKNDFTIFLTNLREKSLAQSFDLISNLNDIFENNNDYDRLKINSKINKEAEQCTIVLKQNLFRVIQELLNNIVKHTNATVVNIELTNNKEFFTLLVEDNGDKPYESSRIDSFGLKGVEERVNLICGNLNVEELRPGTKVVLTFPVEF